MIRRGLTWNPLGRPATATDFARHLRDAAEMDLPTGTITLLLVRDDTTMPTTLSALEAAGGRHATAVSLPHDQSLAVFSRAGDAAAAALDLGGSSNASIALHAGDIGGWHGATLQQLAERCVELLDGGTAPGVVCSTPVRMLLGGDDTLAFQPLTDTRVRLTRASETSRGDVDASQPSVRSGVDRAAGWIATRVARQLAGRTEELRAASAAVDTARSDRLAPLLIVVGEAGMGKTRLLAELGYRASAAGDIVLVGRCTETGGSFEPFLDALGDEFFAFDAGQLERDEEGWVDRRRFFGRIAHALDALDHPITLVIDDMQWIDGSSLALLTQLLDDLGTSLTIVAGCRPGADATIGELSLRPGSTLLSVGPLGTADIASMAATNGLELSAETIEGLHALTGGSPFFGLQLLGHLGDADSGRLDDQHLPAGIRGWVLQRVDRLGDGARETLAPAAVVGRDFEVVVLADVLGVSPLEALTHLDAAAKAGLLVDGAHPGAFRFVHAIVRGTLEESLSATHRALLHAAIARRFEEEAADLDRLEAAMHHWFAAERLGDPLHAGEVAVEVATWATERLAHERAVSILTRALGVLDGAPPTTQRDRVEARLRVALGRAEFVGSRNTEAIAQLYRAAELAESGNDPATLAEAALVASLNRRHGRDDPELLRLLERASEHCPPQPAVLPAMLHVRRSRLLPLTVRHEERSSMARLALVDLDLMEPVDRATVQTEVGTRLLVSGRCVGTDRARRRGWSTEQRTSCASAVRHVGPAC